MKLECISPLAMKAGDLLAGTYRPLAASGFEVQTNAHALEVESVTVGRDFISGTLTATPVFRNGLTGWTFDPRVESVLVIRETS